MPEIALSSTTNVSLRIYLTAIPRIVLIAKTNVLKDGLRCCTTDLEFSPEAGAAKEIWLWISGSK